MTKIAIFTALYPPAVNGGGPIRSTEVLVETAPSTVIPMVLTSDRDLGARVALPVTSNQWSWRGRAKTWYATAGSLCEVFRGYVAVKKEDPILLNFNSFFSAKFTIVPLLLWRLGFWGRPILLIAPRGEFGKGALDRRAKKKLAYVALFRLLGIHRSIIWHATAKHEKSDIERIWGTDATVILREESTLMPNDPLLSSNKLNQIPRFVFLGRIVEHKGLSVVLEALSLTNVPLILDIYGPEEDPSYVGRCRQIVAALPQHVSVEFKGPLPPEQVRKTLETYDALLLPTAGENFGHVIAESLSVSCPVFSTPFTPWTEILNSGGGTVVNDRDPKSWLESINRFATMSPEARNLIRIEAAGAYRRWKALPEKQHIWDLAFAIENTTMPSNGE